MYMMQPKNTPTKENGYPHENFPDWFRTTSIQDWFFLSLVPFESPDVSDLLL